MTKQQFINERTEEKEFLLRQMRTLFSLAKFPALTDEDTIDNLEQTETVISRVEGAIDDLEQLVKHLKHLANLQEDLECDLDAYEWDEE